LFAVFDGYLHGVSSCFLLFNAEALNNRLKAKGQRLKVNGHGTGYWLRVSGEKWN
jgi:hypothetical protein